MPAPASSLSIAGTVGDMPTIRRYVPSGNVLCMVRILRTPAAAAAPDTSANAPASIGIAVSMTREAMSFPTGLCGVMSP